MNVRVALRALLIAVVALTAGLVLLFSDLGYLPRWFGGLLVALGSLVVISVVVGEILGMIEDSGGGDDDDPDRGAIDPARWSRAEDVPLTLSETEPGKGMIHLARTIVCPECPTSYDGMTYRRCPRCGASRGVVLENSLRVEKSREEMRKEWRERARAAVERIRWRTDDRGKGEVK